MEPQREHRAQHSLSYVYACTAIGGDNDAVIKIASDAASAKRALLVLRRMGHARWQTDNGDIAAVKLPRELNAADTGTHYCTREILAKFERALRNMG